ncbi:AfsA-related hotdog domain-containing protein [Catenulispora rubra]|uniref:AfsA-related hotdog domain-containing protein n=1 Tax=Catenulispora rubra TaxID=280293 RepID=UPI0018924C26|nr:AfsA-related hotdog domain-containing protein [Catenulispora rubra]
MNPPSAAAPIVLVGDRFDHFSGAGLGVGVTGFAEAVGRGDYDDLAGPVQVHLGQGLDEAAVAEAGEAVERRGLARQLLLDPRDLPTPVETRAVHKHDARNVLLADFEHCGPYTFEASLRLHNDNELLQDHQAGAHLQGMVLVEAARQMFLAVCELAYLRPWPDRRFSFLLTQVDTKFERLVFPLPMQMRLTAHRADTENVNRMQFDTETRFVQGGREAATTRVAAMVRPLDRTTPVELRTAATAIAALEKAKKARPLAGR